MCKYSSKKRLNHFHCSCSKSLCMRYDRSLYSNAALWELSSWCAVMAAGLQQVWSDLHFSRLSNIGDGLPRLQNCLGWDCLGGRIMGERPLALALGLSHRSYCSSTERRDKTGPRPSVKRCWAGHNCRDLQTPSTIYSLPSHPPQSSQSASHLSTPLSLQCWSSEWCCQNTTPWFPNTPSASLGTARLSV